MLRSHVLVMGFIGKDGMYVSSHLWNLCWHFFLKMQLEVCFCPRPAPLLKNAALSESKACELYLQVIQNMRLMYQEARLVHADLSEFNILWVSESSSFILRNFNLGYSSSFKHCYVLWMAGTMTEMRTLSMSLNRWSTIILMLWSFSAKTAAMWTVSAMRT